MRAALFLTLGFCSIAAGAAVYLESVWLGLVGTGSSLAANLPVFLVIDLAPLAVYALSAVLARKHWGVLLASCGCAFLAAVLWLLAALSPVTEGPDPAMDVGLLGFCVAAPNCFMALFLMMVVIPSVLWRDIEAVDPARWPCE
jgi:hypothetical protein